MTEQNAAFPHIFSPLQVGPIELRSRVLITAHVPRLADDNIPGPRYAEYHRVRARGGAGMQLTGGTPVHPTSGRAAGNALENTDDRIIPGYKLLSDAVHEEGGRILAQLAHYGATITSSEPGVPVWSPSGIGSELARAIPHEMTIAEIAEVVTAFGEAARRAKEGGMDGVEILGAFGLLIAAFMSPYSNKRTDAYGGTLENRLRFPLEVIGAVRDAVGSERIVGMRIPGDEFVEGGLDQAAMREIAPRLEQTGKLDYLNIAAGNNLDRIHRTTHWPPTPAPHGLFVPLASAIKEVVSLPVFAVGRIVDPAMAEEILASGQADMVGMTRAHIADPELLTKAREGRAEDIRKCVGANVCISRALVGSRITCLHNPEAAREHELGPAILTKKAKSVAVIGGGPGGLEAARVAAERGHRVALYEGEGWLGGQFALRASIPNWTEFQHVIDWRRRRLEQLQVRIELGRRIEVSDIPKLGADAIVLASGATPRVARLPGMTEAGIEVVTPQALVNEGRPDARHAVIWDRAGGIVGAGAIEYMAAQGGALTVVTPSIAVADDTDVVRRVPFYERVLSTGARFLPNTDLIALEPGAVVTRNVYSYQEERLSPVDLLVAWIGSDAQTSLRAAIETAGIELHVIGDGLAPRTADVAIAEGMLAARKI